MINTNALYFAKCATNVIVYIAVAAGSYYIVCVPLLRKLYFNDDVYVCSHVYIFSVTPKSQLINTDNDLLKRCSM